MKRKIIALTIAAIATVSALIGQNAIISATNNDMISVENIIDWNTNGTELSISLSDGTEVYAYKSENVYKQRIQYIATGNIVDIQNTGTGFTIICADGSGYYFEKQEERTWNI